MHVVSSPLVDCVVRHSVAVIYLVLLTSTNSSPEIHLKELHVFTLSAVFLADQCCHLCQPSPSTQNSSSWVLNDLAAVYWRVMGNGEMAVRCLKVALQHAPVNYRVSVRVEGEG